MVTTNEVGQALARVLESGGEVQRCAAAQALGWIGCREALDSLVGRLGDEDEDVRVDAVEALGRIGDRRAGGSLLASLVEDPCGDVKLATTLALGRLKYAAAIPVLRELVRGREGRVVWDEEEFLSEGWDDWLDVQVKAIEALGEMGAGEALPDIVAALEDEMGQDLDAVAFKALTKLGEAGFAVLAGVLRTGRERRRRQAAEALRESGSRDACETLAIALDDRSAGIRGTVLSALAARDPRDARLGAFLADPDPRVRSCAVRLVGPHWPEQLDRLLDDPSEKVQAATVDLLSANTALARPKDLEFRLRVKMRGPSELVAAAACQAIVRLAPEAALADLREQLHDVKCPAEVRRAAARALAKLGSAEAVEALCDSVGDDHREVRTGTIGALAEVARKGPASGSAIPVLVSMLRGELVPPPEGTELPETAMREDRPPEFGPVPEEAQGDGTEAAAEEPWPKTSLQAITAGNEELAVAPTMTPGVELDEADLELLARTTSRARKKHVSLNPPLVVHEDVRRLAALVLGDVGSAEVAEALAAVLDDEDAELRRRAADSLARAGSVLGGLPSGVRDRLLGCLEGEDRDLRLAATRALAMTSKDALPALAGCLEDSDSFVRAEAVRGLAALGADSAALLGLLSDDYPGVRLAAAKAIARLKGAEALAPLVELAFAYQGMHAEEVAGLLRDLDRDGASARLLATLRDSGQQRRWRVAIDILKHLNRPISEPAARMVA